MTVQAIGYNRAKQYFRLHDDSILPWCGMMDINGDDTNDPTKAIVVLFQLPDGMYSGIDLREFTDDMIEVTQ